MGQFGNIVKRRGKVYISPLEAKAKEIMATGMFKRIMPDSDTTKKFRLLNTPFIIKIVKPPKGEIEISWWTRGWKKRDGGGRIIEEKKTKLGAVIESDRVPIMYRRKLLFRLGDLE